GPDRDVARMWPGAQAHGATRDHDAQRGESRAPVVSHGVARARSAAASAAVLRRDPGRVRRAGGFARGDRAQQRQLRTVDARGESAARAGWRAARGDGAAGPAASDPVAGFDLLGARMAAGTVPPGG